MMMIKLHVILAGNPNTHTADMVARPVDQPQIWSDMVITKHSRWLTVLLHNCYMEYLNGTSCFAPSSEWCTFFKGDSIATVIDYIVCLSAIMAAGRVFEMSMDELGLSLITSIPLPPPRSISSLCQHHTLPSSHITCSGSGPHCLSPGLIQV